MLGKSDKGLTPAEQKGIEGVIGEDVYFKDGYLLGNIKLFSEDLASKIGQGKNELSCGYRCKYELSDGIFGDQEYQVVQKVIRGNHLASVPEGRMGPDVAVLDEKNQFIFTVDGAELIKMADPKKEVLTGDAAIAALTKTVDGLVSTVADMAEKAKDMEEEKAKSKAEDAEAEELAAKKKAEDEEAEKKAKAEGEDGDMEKENKAAMDSMGEQIKTLTTALDEQKSGGMKAVMAEIGARDELYSKVSEHTGAFDHANMTSHDVAAYACDKLELGEVTKGHELTAVNFFLKDRAKGAVFSMDAAAQQSASDGAKLVTNHFNQ